MRRCGLLASSGFLEGLFLARGAERLEARQTRHVGRHRHQNRRKHDKHHDDEREQQKPHTHRHRPRMPAIQGGQRLQSDDGLEEAVRAGCAPACVRGQLTIWCGLGPRSNAARPHPAACARMWLRACGGGCAKLGASPVRLENSGMIRLSCPPNAACAEFHLLGAIVQPR